MNWLIYTADRSTHLKIVVTGLTAARTNLILALILWPHAPRM
jgi:hypothetical protein